MTPTTMLPPSDEGLLEETWFVEAAPASEPPPSAEDPELDGEWFARGRPLSSRPPPPEVEA